MSLTVDDLGVENDIPHDSRTSGLPIAGLLCVLGPFVVGLAAVVADGLNGGATPDEGWEEGVVIAFGIVATLTSAIFGGVAVGRKPRIRVWG